MDLEKRVERLEQIIAGLFQLPPFVERMNKPATTFEPTKTATTRTVSPTYEIAWDMAREELTSDEVITIDTLRSKLDKWTRWKRSSYSPFCTWLVRTGRLERLSANRFRLPRR